MGINIRFVSMPKLLRTSKLPHEFHRLFSFFKKNYGEFDKVTPASVTKVVRNIPNHIKKPDYWLHGQPRLRFNSSVEPISAREELDKMRKACSLARKVLSAAGQQVKPGVTTEDIDDFVFNYTISHNAYPSPLNYKKFPKSVCTSVNNIACHGIPDTRKLKDGDIVNIDVMAYIDGYHGDCSETFLVGNVDQKGRELVDAARSCMEIGLSVCGPSVPLRKIGATIEAHASELGYTVIPCFTGHGIGKQIHLPPDIYHIDYPYDGIMTPGMIFTVEPVIGQGGEDVVILSDQWSAVTIDGSRTAQFEQTILVTKEGYEILTK